MMATIERRVSSIETVQPHLATKADLAQLEARLLKWMVVTVFGGMTAADAIAAAVSRLLEQ